MQGTSAIFFSVTVGFACGAVTVWLLHTKSKDQDQSGSSAELVPDNLTKDEETTELLKTLTRSGDPSAQIGRPVPLEYELAIPPRRSLTPDELAAFRRDGFLVCKKWFSREEIGLLQRVVESDHQLQDQKISVKDTEGRDTKLTLWWYLGDDTYSMFGRSASLVKAVSQLMGGAEPFHSHSKVLLKEPHSGGAWEWHQDFGYWYSQGLLHPDLIVNAIIPIDQNTEENGCMRLMRRSHTLGRIDHGNFEGQAGADPARVVAAMKLGGYEVVKLRLEPGDVAFMHSNTLHASAPNQSPSWRRNIIVAYNSKENEPLPGSPAGQPMYNQIRVVPDTAIMDTGVKKLDATKNSFLK